MGTLTPLPTAAMCSLGLVHTHLCVLCQPPPRPGSFSECCLLTDSSSGVPLLGHACSAACETNTALGQVLDDLQQPWESQAGRERTMPRGRRRGLICLGAACVLSLLVAASWDRILDLLQSMDKVRGSDQPDVVRSPSA